MILLGIVSAGLVLLVICFILIRLLLDVRFAAIQKEPDQTPLFRRKVNHLRKIEQAKHIRYLLFSCLTIGFALMLFIAAFLVLVDDYQKINAQKISMNERIVLLEKQQKQLIASIPLKNYPEEGIGLKGYAWDKVASEVSNSDLQDQIESDISKRTRPYFGSYETTVLLAESQKMTLELKGWLEEPASQETIKKNLDAFAKEAEIVPEMQEIHVRMVTSIGEKKKVIYNVTYSREKSEDQFTKKNSSEQKLKNDGGKG